MDIQKYNKATNILRNIEHVNKVFEFIRDAKISGSIIMMKGGGFSSYPERVILDRWEIDYLIESYENIKNKLQQELEGL